MRNQSDNPALAQAFGLVFVGFIMPVLLVITWRMALQFDPLTMNVFVKNAVELTPEMPGQMRIGGFVIMGFGALLGFGAVQGFFRQTANLRQAAVMMLAGLEIAALGGGYFVVADVVKAKVEQEQMP